MEEEMRIERITRIAPRGARAPRRRPKCDAFRGLGGQSLALVRTIRPIRSIGIELFVLDAGCAEFGVRTILIWPPAGTNSWRPAECTRVCEQVKPDRWRRAVAGAARPGGADRRMNAT
jgi:hypothetical protein